MDSILAAAAIAAVLYYLYYSVLSVGYETATAINEVPTFGFINPADDVVNPARIGPIKEYNQVSKRVPGQFGIPKTYYNGVGGGTTPTYGNTWSNF